MLVFPERLDKKRSMKEASEYKRGISLLHIECLITLYLVKDCNLGKRCMSEPSWAYRQGENHE